MLDSAENVKELNLKSIDVSLDPVSVFSCASMISLSHFKNQFIRLRVNKQFSLKEIAKVLIFEIFLKSQF